MLSAAISGDPQAQYDWGEIRRISGKNPTKAAKWYRLAADQGLGPAQAQLGILYLNGTGVVQDDSQAIQLFRSAATQNLAKGQYFLGFMYYHGRAVQKDYAYAARWFKKSAAQDYSLACVALGELHRLGQGVPKNAVTALKLFRKADELGSHNGTHAVAGMYYLGQAVSQDTDRAIDLYKESAERGNMNSIRKLSQLYLRSGDFDRSIQFARAATQIDSSHARSQYVLARGLQKTGAESASIEAYRRAIAIDPLHPIWINNLAWLLIAANDESLRDPVAALELARRAVDESADPHPVLLGTLIEALISNERIDEAHALASESLLRHPDDTDLAEQKSRIRIKHPK